METLKTDVAIIGAGPGGYVAAIRCRQLGLKVVCIDKDKSLGGTCLNVGCIPSKALLDLAHQFHQASHLAEAGIKVESVVADISAMMSRKGKVIQDLTQGIHFLMKKNEVTVLQGHARFHTPTTLHIHQEGQHSHVVEARFIIIATGSETVSLPDCPVDEEKIVSSTGALSLPQAPGRLLVIGAGYIGLELGLLWHHLGSQVTMVETAEQLLPLMDTDVGAFATKMLTKKGIHCLRGHKILKLEKTAEGTVKAYLSALSTPDASPQILEVDCALVAVGRRPHTHHLGLEALGITCHERGFIPVDHAYRVPGHPHIFAIGDVIEGPMLAHRASEEGVLVAEQLAGAAPRRLEHDRIPSVIFLDPEIASVGRTEQALKAEGIPYKTGRFAFSANSRARAVGQTEGFIKILAHAESDEVLGVHMVGPEASTMISQAVLALEYKASSEDLARICYPHPTFAEAFKEAALAVSGACLHS